MNDSRCKDVSWNIIRNEDGSVEKGQSTKALLMDLRDELKKLNRVFECKNFLDVPHLLREIKRNTIKPKRKKAQ